jgi:hypothetical protein
MKFFSKYPNLQVILVPTRRVISPLTQEVIDTVPALVVRFQQGIYETKDERTAKLMIAMIENRTITGVVNSFFLDPRDEEEAKNLVESRIIDQVDDDVDLEKQALLEELEAARQTISLMKAKNSLSTTGKGKRGRPAKEVLDEVVANAEDSQS